MSLLTVLIQNLSVLIITSIILHLAARFSLGGAPFVIAPVIAGFLVILRNVLAIANVPRPLSFMTIVVLAYIGIQVGYDTGAWKSFMILTVTVIISLILTVVLGGILSIAGYTDILEGSARIVVS